MNEYPKALYIGDSLGEMRIVANSDEELEARSAGFIDLSEPVSEKVRLKPGPKPKAD
jgi:hypothetical protein